MFSLSIQYRLPAHDQLPYINALLLSGNIRYRMFLYSWFTFSNFNPLDCIIYSMASLMLKSGKGIRFDSFFC
jgi:hypothetical protein